MEWTRIEKKWTEMAMRLQSASCVGGQSKTTRSDAEGTVEPIRAEPSSLNGDKPSGDGKASFLRELA